MRPFGGNVENSFTNHGLEEDSTYYYVLLIDFSGESVLIKRVKKDNTEIRFALKADGTAIATFWANRASETYGYIYELKND